MNREELIKEGWTPQITFLHEEFYKCISYKGIVFHCTIAPYSNTINRDYNVHIDNDHFETVGSMDIANLEQLDKILDLLSE